MLTQKAIRCVGGFTDQIGDLGCRTQDAAPYDYENNTKEPWNVRSPALSLPLSVNFYRNVAAGGFHLKERPALAADVSAALHGERQL